MFTSDMILDATLLPAMAIALVAGLLSFLSPCVLPIVPPYLAYMGGVSVTEMAAGAVGPAARRCSRRRSSSSASRRCSCSSARRPRRSAGRCCSGRAGSSRSPASSSWCSARTSSGVLRIPFLAREARLDAGDRGGSALRRLPPRPRLRLRLDALPRADPRHDPRPRRDRGRRGARHHAARGLRARPRHPVPARRGLLPARSPA